MMYSVQIEYKPDGWHVKDGTNDLVYETEAAAEKQGRYMLSWSRVNNLLKQAIELDTKLH